MHRHEIDRLDRRQAYWVAAVVSPKRDWPAAPGCRRGARFLVNARSLSASREEFDTFDSQLSCLEWIMAKRADLHRALPGGAVRAVRLDRWLLGLE
ncbi:hypothetical protein GON01_02160 [Sphingomonas sp. MAH-20]|jgi:hypothetical protein|uniref:Uncharacterized protein n=1 Tax=Sphingomonas horti TaxID=2682842 RepID=A0A6I4IXC5_9SPHN|nr:MULTISPECIES: hypothetical protein [Sphingomonas]MBA2920493.1 hypothetical protein [Sphingomonas sp. CGMCC 1.13658]MVO76745.1 hypothetical protein [Sphingomonas horti]